MKRSVKHWSIGIILILLFLLLAWIISGVQEDTVWMEVIPINELLEDFSLRLDRIDTALRTQVNVGKKMVLTEVMLEASVENGVIREELLELSYCQLVWDNAAGRYVKTETYRVDMASSMITELLRQSGGERGIGICTKPIAQSVMTVSLTDYIVRALRDVDGAVGTALFAYCHATNKGVEVTLCDGSADGAVLYNGSFH